LRKIILNCNQMETLERKILRTNPCIAPKEKNIRSVNYPYTRHWRCRFSNFEHIFACTSRTCACAQYTCALLVLCTSTRARSAKQAAQVKNETHIFDTPSLRIDLTEGDKQLNLYF